MFGCALNVLSDSFFFPIKAQLMIEVYDFDIRRLMQKMSLKKLSKCLTRIKMDTFQLMR